MPIELNTGTDTELGQALANRVEGVEDKNLMSDADNQKLTNIEDGATQNNGALADLDTVGTTEIEDEAVTTAKLAHIATASILGRNTAGDGDVEVLDATTVRALLQVVQNGIALTNPQTGLSYTLALSDIGVIVERDNAAANAVTIPADATVDFPINATTCVMERGAGPTTIQVEPGVSLNGVVDGTILVGALPRAVCLRKVAADSWIAVGGSS